jgi:predicted ATP-grasp superfamily ATP-dependent carboligase
VANPTRLRDRLLDVLTQLSERAGRRVVVFATEDGGLRCLNEFSADVLKVAEFPRAKALRYGGLDKAELFEYLATSAAARYIPLTEVIGDIEQAEGALLRLGGDAVFKPALKPFDMDLSSMLGAKIVTRASPVESTTSLLERLHKAWPVSRQWVVQSRLQPYETGERGIWAVRGAGSLASVEFVERWKYPAKGGTGCWVETLQGDSFVSAAATILDAIGYVGLAELPFLRTADGHGRLLEINARAWLQVGLAEHSGMPVVLKTLHALSSEPLAGVPNSFQPAVWINIERAMLAAASGSQGSRGRAFVALGKVLMQRHVLAVYSSSVRGVRMRWVGRVFAAVWSRLQRKWLS